MKFNKHIFWYVSLAILIVSVSCNSMDDNYERFLKEGEYIYPGKADSVMVYSGKNRIKLSWFIIDPSVTKAKIYWRNKNDSIEVPIENSKTGIDTVNVILKNMDEGDYTFIIRDFDSEGNISVPTSVSGHVYGNIYIASIQNRVFLSISQLDDTDIVKWGNSSEGTLGTVLKYTNQSGETDSVFVPADTSTISITNLSEEDSMVYYYTLYLPPNSIDTFYTATDEINALGILSYIDLNRSQWQIIDYDSKYLPPPDAIDDDVNTAWSTNWVGGGDPLPHHLTIDMSEIHTVHGFRLKAGYFLLAQRPNDVSFQFSDDGITYRDGPGFTKDIVDELTTIIYLSHPVKARFFKFIIHSNADPNQNVSELSEIYAF